MWVDLHIHSCLSPCADDDMTPANICGMAHIKGLDAIAVTDHNTARNLPYVKEAADYYGLILLPGMEITTREEVHLLGYFRDVETAVEAGEFFSSHLPPMKNKPDFFGNQLVMNTDDEVVDVEERLLIGATDLDLAECTKIIRRYGGAAGMAWVTVQTHMNVIAVASLMEMAAVIIPEGIEMETPSLEKAKDEGICVLQTPLTAYEICARLAAAGLPGKSRE